MRLRRRSTARGTRGSRRRRPRLREGGRRGRGFCEEGIFWIFLGPRSSSVPGGCQHFHTRVVFFPARRADRWRFSRKGRASARRARGVDRSRARTDVGVRVRAPQDDAEAARGVVLDAHAGAPDRLARALAVHRLGAFAPADERDDDARGGGGGRRAVRRGRRGVDRGGAGVECLPGRDRAANRPNLGRRHAGGGGRDVEWRGCQDSTRRSRSNVGRAFYSPLAVRLLERASRGPRPRRGAGSRHGALSALT